MQERSTLKKRAKLYMNTIKINQSNKITVRGGAPFAVSFSTTEHYTSVSAVIDNMDLIVLGDRDKSSKLYVADSRNEITLYGDISSLAIDTELKDVVSSITIESDTLVCLSCPECGVGNINITNAPALKEVHCFGNNLYEIALNKLFLMLPNAPKDEERTVIIKSDEHSNPGLNDCDITLATDKGWRVMNYKSDDTLENTINPSVFPEKGNIHEGNYYDITTAIFEVVTNNNEFDFITKLEPNYTSYKRAKRFWRNEYDFDQVLYFGEVYDDDGELTPDDEAKEVGAIGYAYILGDDGTQDEDGNYLSWPEDDYYVHVIEQGYGDTILCQAMGKEVQSKTWVHNGYVYRFAKFWGNLRSCYWTVNIDGYEDGNQEDFILAKCKLEDFRWHTNV